MQQVGMVGVRIPNHPSALALLRQTGPLATTSINQSGQPALTDPTMILREFPELPLLQGHYGEQNLPSTIVRWQNNAWEVLRQGSVLWPPSPL
jgi:L-threonylcarbamoyladenylate synthase